MKFRVLAGKDCNPQPANCLKDKNVLRHCCINNRSDKTGHSATGLFIQVIIRKTASLFPANPLIAR
ncbi:hypothetical protein A8H26_14845 [Pluralibacter gergoviae]|nr:hypothetical protein A8H26_14845 [Pluralibacter gergoviae]PHH47822.1 hypothetical protein CRX51_19530 [Pluralibacter gergoviae]